MSADPIVERLSQLPEARVLDYFWLMMRREADPLETLRQVGAVIIQEQYRVATPTQVRREHETLQNRRHPWKAGCFVCKSSNSTLFFHHIIEVHHGGSNYARNQVSLCFRCHKDLHPWLKPPVNCAGFESVRSIMERYFTAEA